MKLWARNVWQQLYHRFRLRGDCRSISYNKYWEDVTDEHTVLLHKVLELFHSYSVLSKMQKSVVHKEPQCAVMWAGIVRFYLGFFFKFYKYLKTW